MHVLNDIVIILIAAIVIIVLFSRFKLPSVVGFLLTGMIIGPTAAGLVKDTHGIEIFAEVGVVLMMFIIGIEFSIKKLNRIKRLIFVGGGGQVVFTIIGVLVVSLIFGFSFHTALFFGFLVSLSSTAIVLKLLQDRKEIDSPHGRIELGVLLFQDLCVVPMVVLIPILSLKGGVDISTNLLQISISIVSIGIIFFVVRKLMPYILNVIVRTRLKEIFILSSLFICLGFSLLTNYLGLSLALGAFIAGLIISESRYSHQVVADILPFKESFNSIFFISIGMLLNLQFVAENIVIVLSAGFGIFVLKTLVILVFVLFLKYPVRIAVISAMGLAQVGEFSFVLAKLGLQYELITNDIFQTFLASSILTMLFTPFAFNLSPSVALRAEKGKVFSPIRRREEKNNSNGTDAAAQESDQVRLDNHVIIVGYGLNGKNLASVLKRRKIQYVIIELNPDSVKEAEEKNETVVYGDATKPMILEEAGIKTAKLITFAISDPLVIDHAVATARNLNESIYIIARTKYVSEIDRLYELGADTVFAEEYETSIEILSRVMIKFGFSKEAINREIYELHKSRYALIRDKKEEEKYDSEQLAERVHQKLNEEINIDSYTITGKCRSESKSIAELNIRARTGATIISVIRGTEHIPNPGADFRLMENDIVLLLGNHEQIEKAVEYLS